MGTRHLTAVYVDHDYKVAQYGQWDGYPDGQGMTVLAFARALAEPVARASFVDKVRRCSWITVQEIEAINRRIESGALKNWTSVYPELSRDTGADILHMISNAEAGLKLQNDIEFAADSLFCEWAWVIDMDAGTFEGYQGFNTGKPLSRKERFFFLNNKCRESSGGERYYPVRMVAKWSLDDLPSNDDFLAAFKEEEDVAV